MKQNLFATVLAASLGAAHAVETPYTPFKDGFATVSAASGVTRTLEVQAGTSKAWVIHPLSDGSTVGALKARLLVYVKDIGKDGTLRVSVANPFSAPEANTQLRELKSADSVGAVALKANDHIQGVVSIPLGAAFLEALSDGTYGGLILEGADGLQAELGAIEGGHGALLYLDFPAGGAMDSTVVKSVAAVLAANHKPELRGERGETGGAGPKGDKGDKGDRGEKGDKGDPADQAPVFKLLVDRGARADYSFDAFGSATPRTTPDLSGNANTLTLSTDGVNRVQVAAGDSAIQFLGNGYASAPNSPSLNPYDGITLAAKVRLSLESPPDTQVILSKAGQYALAIIRNGSKGRLMARFKTVLGGWTWEGAGDLTYGDSEWSTVQATYDGKAIRAAVNGKQTFYLPFASGPLVLDSSSLYVGAAGRGEQGFKGLLDQVKVLAYPVGARDQVQADSVVGLAAALAGKANASHVHPVSQVTGLQDSLNAKVAAKGGPLKVCSGRTAPGVGWTDYISNGAVIEINTEACGFTSVPQYFTSLGASTSHWITTGVTSIYSPTATGFKIFVANQPWSSTPVNPPAAWGMYINWVAIGP